MAISALLLALCLIPETSCTSVVGVLVNPTSVSWQDVAVGAKGSLQTVTLTNLGASSVSLSNIAISGANTRSFSIASETCGTTLASNASCTVSLLFAPTAAGPSQATFSFIDSAQSSPMAVPLSGIGTTSIGSAVANPNSLQFGAFNVGTSSPAETITLQNQGTAALSITSAALTGVNAGDFAISANTCGTTLQGSGTCTISVVFSPSAAGTRSAAVTFTDNATNSPQTVSLTGTGNLGSASVMPASLSFANAAVGATTSPQSVTLANGGTASINITSIAISGTDAGDFAISSKTCGTTLAGSGNCTVGVTFTPTAAGTRTAALTFTDSAGNSPQTVALSGTGTSSTANASVTPASLTFAATNVSSTSSPQSVTLANAGTASINITSIAIAGTNAGDFAISPKTCGTTLAGSGNCTVSVTFTPAAAGTRTGTLSFTDSAGNSPQTVVLSGTGTSSTANASVTPASLTFAATNVSSTSSPQSVTLANGGTASINITGIAISGSNAGDFTISAKTCGTTLAGSGNCTVSVTFTPTAAGTRTATLTFTDSAGNSPQTVALSGTGTSNTANASVTPASLTFAATNVSSTSSPQSVTLANGGTASINITSIAIAGTNAGDFTISAKTCGTTLAGPGNCTVSVTFTPATAGTRTGTLTFTDSAGNSPQTVALSGTGTSNTANASVTPASLTFAATNVSSTSSPQTVTLANGGTASINITSIAIAGTNAGDFTISAKTCGTTLAGSGNCTVSVTFTPTAAGTRTATLTFTDSAANSPQTVTLSGTGNSASASVMPTSLSFTNTPVGATSSPQTVTLTNGGTVSINITSIAISGTNAGDFAISANTCGTTLAGSGNCTVSVTFTPTAAGTRTATLTFTDSATNSPQSVALTGNGVAFSILPVNPTVVVNEVLQFSANAPATWTASCGIMNNTATGLYTAPSSPQTCTVTATENASPHSIASTQVTVVASSSGTFAVYPSTAAVPAGGEQVFQAQLSNAPDTNSLSYSVDGVAGGDSTSGTVTGQGLYTAPSTAGSHLLVVTDNSLGLTATASITVYSNVTVDFGSRASNTNPVPAGLFGTQYLESLHTTADLALVEAGGITSGRTYAQITNVFATTTPNWGPLDATIKKITANGGVHVMLEMYQSPTWLQQGTCGVESMPSDVNAWASIAQQIVQHMDVTFPGVATDYEIWNEPDIALCVPAGDNALTDYIKLYSAAVPLMKAQAKTDGQTIRVGGPVTAGLDSTWVTAILNDPVVSQNIDFLSYHSYLVGKPGETAAWDTYNGTPSIYQITQGSESPANIYEYAGSLAAGGLQPQGKNLPIYITEYNLDWLFVKTCCTDDYTYAPLWNALYVADLLDAPFAYTGAPNSMSRLIYYAAANPPYYCLVGELDTNMDCAYPQGTPAQPYPQYFTYQLLGSPQYLDLQDGGYLATSISPPRLENGLVVTAYFTPSLDAVVLINPSQYTYTNLPIDLANPGFTSPQATLYQIANGLSIQSSPLSLNATSGSSFTTTVTLAPYSVQAIALH